MTTWLVHGFNVSDGGRGSIGRLKPYLEGDVRRFSYGWTGLLKLRVTNRQAERQLLQLVRPGDVLIGHSNGALVCHRVAQRLGDQLAAVVVINPALRRDTRWPDSLPVLCLANSTDWVVQLGRVWSRLVSLGRVVPQGWGAAGRYGFTSHQPNVTNYDTAMAWWTYPVRGHSGLFEGRTAPRYWGGMIRTWLEFTCADARDGGV